MNFETLIGLMPSRRHGVYSMWGLVLLLMTACPPSVAQERTCPDGKRSFFGVCPGETALPGPLQTKVRELASFPDDIDVGTPPDVLEGMFVNKTPVKLYNILISNDKDAIEAIPDIGKQLYVFREDYYSYRQKELQFENDTAQHIGTMVTVSSPAAWMIYLRYFLLRASGNTQRQVEGWGSFLNFDITWDAAEKIYAQLSADPKISGKFAENTATYLRLANEATLLLEQSKK